MGRKHHYAERDRKGRFSDITKISRSVAADARRKTRKKMRRGYGHLGDVKN